VAGILSTFTLTEFACENSYGTSELHANWNQLFFIAVQDIQGYFNIFSGGATFYPGDTITFKLENGSEISAKYACQTLQTFCGHRLGIFFGLTEAWDCLSDDCNTCAKREWAATPLFSSSTQFEEDLSLQFKMGGMLTRPVDS
jgi:hypothetical protein